MKAAREEASKRGVKFRMDSLNFVVWKKKKSEAKLQAESEDRWVVGRPQEDVETRVAVL